MKQKVFFNLLPITITFLVISLIWVILRVPNVDILKLLLGFGLGTIFLDLDHVIYWLYRKPNTDESRLAQNTIQNKDFKSFYKLIKIAQKNHSNLIFHHYFFQIGLNFISLFIFLSSSNTFLLSFLLSTNLHLLVDEFDDYLHNPKFLQNWLFAREEKQLPLKYLKNYLIIFSIFFLFFVFVLVKSKA